MRITFSFLLLLQKLCSVPTLIGTEFSPFLALFIFKVMKGKDTLNNFLKREHYINNIEPFYPETKNLKNYWLL